MDQFLSPLFFFMGLSNSRDSHGEIELNSASFFLFFPPSRVMFNLKLLFGGNTGHNADCVCDLIYDRAVHVSPFFLLA